MKHCILDAIKYTCGMLECEATISIAVFDAASGSLRLEPLITKGAKLPASASWRIETCANFQQVCRLHVYEGEGTKIDPNLVRMIVEAIVKPVFTSAPLQLNITVEQEGDGQVQVRAARVETGESVPCDLIRQGKHHVQTQALTERKSQLESQLRDINARLGASVDVFISAKSADFIFAGVVKAFLENNGINAFLSSQSLQALSNADYRKEIDRALDRAHNLIVVASSVDNLMSPWVEAEWGLFINEKRSGRKKGNITTVVAGALQGVDLPASLRYYEVFSFSSEEFQRLLKYIVW